MIFAAPLVWLISYYHQLLEAWRMKTYAERCFVFFYFNVTAGNQKRVVAFDFDTIFFSSHFICCCCDKNLVHNDFENGLIVANNFYLSSYNYVGAIMFQCLAHGIVGPRWFEWPSQCIFIQCEHRLNIKL